MKYLPNSSSLPNLYNPDLVSELGLPPEEVSNALHPSTLESQGTMTETIRSLHSLPFLSAKDVQNHLQYDDAPSTSKLVDGVSFPISRIVGVSGFDSWAGRGLDQRGLAIENGGYSSASAVHYYSHRSQDPNYIPQVTLFKDTDGGVWGFTDNDGAHRTAGAKVRGDTALLCQARIDEYDRLPVFEGSVSEVVLEQQKSRTSFIGKTILKRQIKVLAKASEKFDIDAGQRRADMKAKMETSKGTGYWL